MRDRQAYIDAGRNDPGSDQQKQEHPYDFVSLPERPDLVPAVEHNTRPADRWSGVLRLVYRTESPLHVGSGIFETTEDCGLEGSGTVRGIVRSGKGPVLPGSSWKGAIRSRFEAITRSRLTLAMSKGQVWPEKFPKALYSGSEKQHLQITDPRVKKAVSLQSDGGRLPRLSPAESLFGCMGYRGRVLPGEGRIEGGQAKRALSVAVQESPRMHRLATQDGLVRDKRRDNQWNIQRVEGRKFYYDGELVSKRTTDGRDAFDRIDYVVSGAEIHIDVQLQSLDPEELGALLVACGYGDRVGVVRFGKYKSVGLGKVSLISIEHRLREGGPTRERSGKPLDLEDAVETGHRKLIEASALEELHQITTTRRPG